MVAELSGKTSKTRLAEKGGTRRLEHRLLDSLVFKYLCDIGCDYTVGVFLPEAGITRREVSVRYIISIKFVCYIQ